jgi:hypothetical protein
MFTRHSGLRGCKSRIYRSIVQYSSTKFEKDLQKTKNLVESDGDSGDYLGVTVSGHLEEKTEEIQTVLSKEELSRLYGIGSYNKPHAYDGQVQKANFGCIKIDGVRKGYIPAKGDFSSLQPNLGSIANTLTRYRKNVDWKKSPQPISHLLMKQSEVYDGEKDSLIEENVDIVQHHSEKTNRPTIDKEGSSHSKPNVDTTNDSMKTNKAKVLLHQAQSNCIHNADQQLLSQPEEMTEKTSDATYSDIINRIANPTHYRPVPDKIHQAHEFKTMQMDESITVKKRNTIFVNGKITTVYNEKSIGVNKVYLKKMKFL